jgi:hypothetical protein
MEMHERVAHASVAPLVVTVAASLAAGYDDIDGAR